jgi:hypothetical protein
MADNDEAGGSHHQKQYWEMSIDDDPQPQPRYEGIGDDSTDPEYTTASGDDCGAAEADPATDDGSQPTDGSQPKRQKKERRPSKLGTVKEEFTEVDKNGLPTAPKELVGGYAGQLGCILRGTVSINTENLRHPDRANLRNLLFTKLHNRYKFPAQFANTRLHGNKVNSAALTKMSTSLATWRSTVKKMICKGVSYEKIKESNPSISETDYEEFKLKCEDTSTSESSQWGKSMRELNLGVHRLGPGGYRVAEPKWDKEDAERAAQGLPPLFKKYGDKPTDNYVRARYKRNPVTGELTTDPKVEELERLLVKNTSPC